MTEGHTVLVSKIIRFVCTDWMRRVLERPVLIPLLNAGFYKGWRLIHGGAFAGDLNGVKMVFYDPGGPEGYWTSFFTRQWYEHSVMNRLAQIAKQYDTPVFVDVGAHYGYHTVYMSKLGGPSGKVYAFEPNKEYFKVLSINARLNKLQNAVLQSVALSDKNGPVVLETSRRMKARGFLREKRKMRTLMSPASEGEACTAITFDEMAQASDISPDIVKIDVHGAEGNVISGMKKTLRHGVSHLFCELHGEMSDGYCVRDVVSAMQDAGMEIFEFRGFRGRDGRLVAISQDLFSNPHDRMIYARN